MLNRVVFIDDIRQKIKINNPESIKKVITQFITFIENNINIIKGKKYKMGMLY